MSAVRTFVPLMRFENLRKSIRPGRPLLDIGELRIYPGQCLLLTGPNGAGKTTLLKILSGLEPPDKTTNDAHGKAMVHIGDSRLPWHAARRKIFRDVIYLHQHAYLFDSSVFENIRYGLRHQRMQRNQVAERIHRALDWAGLSHLEQRNARELSGGEKQRVALTRALVLQPRVLMLDEPFSGLDENARNRTGLLIRRIKSEGVAVVVTSHELQPVLGIADSHLELRDGRLVIPANSARPGIKSMPTRTTRFNTSPAFFNAKVSDEIG